LAIHAADPVETQRIVFEFVASEERLERKPAPDRAHHAAILRRKAPKRLDRLEAAGTDHVLMDDRRMTWNVLAHMPGQRARIDIIGRARGRIDDHRQLPALVELFRRLRAGSGRAGENDKCGNSRAHQVSHGCDLSEKSLCSRAISRRSAWTPD